MAAETSIIDLDERPDLADRTFAPRSGRHRAPEPERGTWASRSWLLAVIAVGVAVVAGGLALVVPGAAREPDLPGSDTPAVQTQNDHSETHSETPALRVPAHGTVDVAFNGNFFSWALLDEQGRIFGSDNLAETTWVGSIVKAWVVADFLRHTTEQGKQPTAAQLAWASKAIRDSHDQSANALYQAAGRTDQLHRMISICDLTDTTIEGNRWRSVRMSARDAVRLGRCIADGRAAGPEWTEWVRIEMSLVRGTLDPADQPYGGRWGIIDGLAAEQQKSLGIINGWIVVESEDEWQVNCLAVTDEWSLSVLTRYPSEQGLRYGAKLCRDVTTQLAAAAS